MLTQIPFPLLPPPPSWYPGHMTRFSRMLPTLLSRTDVVLELRDSRLPLTSINRTLEGALHRWRLERGRLSKSSSTSIPTLPPTPESPAFPPSPIYSTVCEHIVVLNKRDLVPEWGLEPFRKAMASKFPDQQVFFASWQRQQDIKALNELLVNVAKSHPAATELNVLVIGMPNVGKSTLLNALRNIGIRGPTPKALRTSAHPGLTQAISTRLKLSQDPLVYSYDSPGVMLPFLGRGETGAERGVKLALIAGIKEGLYDVEALAAYLLYRLNVLNPISPAYLHILPPSMPPTTDVAAFLELLAQRLGMLKRGGIRDIQRAAKWFIKWWREEGGLLSASAPDASIFPSVEGVQQRMGWGFDCEWSVNHSDVGGEEMVQRKMEECIDMYMKAAQEEERDGAGVSSSQAKKMGKQADIARRVLRVKAKLTSRRR